VPAYFNFYCITQCWLWLAASANTQHLHWDQWRSVHDRWHSVSVVTNSQLG